MGFKDRLKAMRCRRFKGKQEVERIEAVFRYLDPSGEGSISVTEWSVLEQLWKEIILSLKEFVNFLGRAFGRESGVLVRAWTFFDMNGSGEITAKEWHQIVEQRLDYFGPAMTIFYFLDKGGEGKVSWAEFKELEKVS